ncbi:hypothetical protein ADL35_07670 [Streptomyces sp. NRRL WC-3753]|nr:hypothetical protein ADL35_07670 [Streptomyces sp. NRRL WC-3753]
MAADLTVGDGGGDRHAAARESGGGPVTQEARDTGRAPDRSSGERRPLWRQRDFGVFWAAQTLSVLGDSFALIALPLLVLEATGSIARMGLLTAVGGAAAVLAAVFAGTVVDRVDRRGLLIGCDLVRMVLYGLIPLVWLLGPQIWLLYAVLPDPVELRLMRDPFEVELVFCRFTLLSRLSYAGRWPAVLCGDLHLMHDSRIRRGEG